MRLEEALQSEDAADTAAQIFLSGAICTWALFASLWLLSIGVRRSKERGVELRALKAPHSHGVAAGYYAGPEADTEPTINLDVLHPHFEPARERHTDRPLERHILGRRPEARHIQEHNAERRVRE